VLRKEFTGLSIVFLFAIAQERWCHCRELIGVVRFPRPFASSQESIYGKLLRFSIFVVLFLTKSASKGSHTGNSRL
ncbi:hypothetical protein BC829DRAFT_409960, partial [Chytridium lagenaria]